MKNIPFFIPIIGLFFGLGGISDFGFLLQPACKILEWLWGNKPVFTPKTGYFFKEQNVVIDDSCAGFNLWRIYFLVLAYVWVQHSKVPIYKIIGIVVALFPAYLLGVCTNTSRIVVSVWAEPFLHFFGKYRGLLHEAIGIFNNLFFLICAYLFAEKIIPNHEKSS